ncbi:hypothetical protein ScPMuIL_000796 [Solemya velum]
MASIQFGEEGTLEIDGGVLEGGGQVLRNSAALSCLMQRPIHVRNIRAGRSSPGLRPQHLTGLLLIRDLCRAQLEGAGVGSQEISLTPSSVQAGSYTADTKTAGSICLLMQAALPCTLIGAGPCTMRLRGGTNAEMAPQVDYTMMVFKPVAERFGMHFDCDIIKRGYFPKGGGEVVVRGYPAKQLTAVNMTDFGEVRRIYGRSFAAGVIPKRVAHIMAESAESVIRQDYKSVPIEIERVKESEQAAMGSGAGITIVGETSTGCLIAGTALGKKGVPAEKVGEQAGEMLLNNLFNAGCVDDFLQDQVVLLMALAKGKSKILCGPITLHTQTAIHITELLTKAKFTITNLTQNSTTIECEGIGLVNKNL